MKTQEILVILYFNSQPHKEADGLLGGLSSLAYPYFNSQPHKEADRTVSRWDNKSYYFNSQPHKEADSNFIQ